MTPTPHEPCSTQSEKAASRQEMQAALDWLYAQHPRITGSCMELMPALTNLKTIRQCLLTQQPASEIMSGTGEKNSPSKQGERATREDALFCTGRQPAPASVYVRDAVNRANRDREIT
jgi:hypothetical protein